MKRNINKTDPTLISLISDLKSKERENGAAIWRDVAKRLEKPRRNWAETNLSKLERYAKDGETIIVPGKVLAAGNIRKKIVVAAYNFSESAKIAIIAAGGKAIRISDLMIENPQGSNIKIMR
ncbi:MAG: 50S ribosomal protein L18e [archaeon]|nr:50S ribosomal protein L18e [archaeon]